MKVFRCEPENIILGSVLRRAISYLLTERDLRYDPQRLAQLNDLVFGEITQVPTRPFEQLKFNWLERLYAHADGVKLRNEIMRPGPCIGVVGNRYAPPYLIGGLTNPLTGQPNGEVRGDALVDGLFSINALGFVNREADPEERVRISVRGVVVDDRGRSVNLSRFREMLPYAPESLEPQPHLIVVAGHSTNSGKTTCAWALVSELQSRGFNVTTEKKTGTACCRDWLRCYADPRIGVLESKGDEVFFPPDRFPARDFADGLGVASDVSVGRRRFVPASVQYTRAFLAQARSDFHIIELADSISHVSNEGLLRSKYFRQQIKTLIYSSIPTHEAVAHLSAYLRGLGYHLAQVLLSGPLANEEQHDCARDEIRERLGLRICRSAIKENGRWIPEGSELVKAVLEESSRWLS
jgi:hypothetical protein